MSWWGLPEKYLIGMAVWIVILAVLPRLLLKLRRSGESKPLRKKLAHLGLSIWLLLALLTLIELGFALFYDKTDSFDLSNVSKKWFARYAEPTEKPLRFSSGEGFFYRDDREFDTEVAADRVHLCFLGDSFTYGHGINEVADRFSNRIRARLERDHPDDYVVSNLARPGTDLLWAEATLRHMFEDDIRVDTAIYTICLNDIESFDPNTFAYHYGDWTRGSDWFLFRDTYFFNLLYFRVMQASHPEVRSYYEFVYDYYEGEPWEKMVAKIREIDKLCEEHGCDFRIVIFPFLHSLDEYQFQFAHDKIAELCRENDIPVVDLLPTMRNHKEESLVVSRFDAHPNVSANRYAAEAIEAEWFDELPENESP